MNHKDQISHFANELRAVVNRFKAEYELCIADAIGTIEVVKLELFAEQTKIDEEGGLE